METGEIRHVYKGRAPGNGAMLATGGDLVFWGDLDRRFRAFDVESGDILWEAIVSGPITNSTISYAVDGKQYIALFVGQGRTDRTVDGTRRTDRAAGQQLDRRVRPAR